MMKAENNCTVVAEDRVQEVAALSCAGDSPLASTKDLLAEVEVYRTRSIFNSDYQKL